MTINEARLIRHIKRSSTYRALAEIYYSANHNGHGNQLYGKDLCIKAFAVLYPHRRKHPFEYEYGKQSEQFEAENKSLVGDFYWWE